jgi:hypothetical protein
MAGTVAQLAPTFVLLLALVATLSLIDRCVSGRPLWSRLHRRRRDRSAVQTEGRPIQVVAADLRRLSRQLALVPAGAPLVRWQALWAAYDDVLMEAADALEVPHELPTTPNGLPRDFERVRLVTALEDAGLAVHD